MQQLLTNMCCNITQQAGAKSEDAKGIQMSGGEEFQETEMVASRSGSEQVYPTYLSLFNLPSLLGEPQATDTPRKGPGISMLKNHLSP